MTPSTCIALHPFISLHPLSLRRTAMSVEAVPDGTSIVASTALQDELSCDVPLKPYNRTVNSSATTHHSIQDPIRYPKKWTDADENENNDQKFLSFDMELKHPALPRYPIVEPEFKMTVASLIQKCRLSPIAVSGDLSIVVTGVQNDSRKVMQGDIFVPCVGCKTNGKLYIKDAIKRGAIAVIVNENVSFNDIPIGCRAIVIVENGNSLLPVLASTFYNDPSKKLMPVVGITGTNGKTTTAHLVRAIHEEMTLRTGMLGTVGYYIGGNIEIEAPNTTPDAVMVQQLMAKMVHNGTQALVMEVSSHGLAMGRCDEVDFNVAVFMNLTRDHYDFHKTEADYRDSKAKLFNTMVDPQRHCKVVNFDDPNAQFFVSRGNEDVPIVKFAMMNKDADVYPLMLKLSLRETWVLISTPKGILEINSGLIGRHNVYNILAAVSVGIAVGASLETIKRGVEGVHGVSGRFEIIDEGQGFGVIVDFAHSPDALLRLLDTVRELGARRIITVFGCAGESDKGKRPMMTKIATEKSEVVILTSDNPKSEDSWDILNDMLAGVSLTMHDYIKLCKHDSMPCLPNGSRILVHDNRRVALRAAIGMADEGDIVVVAGRGHETYQMEGHRKIYLDDREECKEALSCVDKLRRAGIGRQIPLVPQPKGKPQICFSEGTEARNLTKQQKEVSDIVPAL